MKDKKIKDVKYWYKTDIYVCVLCGCEKKYRQRVTEETKKGTDWHEDACSRHF